MEQSYSWEADLFSDTPKFATSYGTRRFINAFTSARHLSLSRASSIQSMPPHRTSWGSFIILSSHLRLILPSGIFHSGFHTKTLYTPILASIHATCLANLIVPDLITRQIIWVQTLRKYVKNPSLTRSAVKPRIFQPVPQSLYQVRCSVSLSVPNTIKFITCSLQSEQTYY